MTHIYVGNLTIIGSNNGLSPGRRQAIIWSYAGIKRKHFPRNWPFVREIHRSPVNCPHKGQWRGALMFSLIYAWINDWVNNREAGDLRRQHDHYDVIVMILLIGCLGTNISELGIEIQTFPFAKQAYESVIYEMAAILFLHQSII